MFLENNNELIFTSKHFVEEKKEKKTLKKKSFKALCENGFLLIPCLSEDLNVKIQCIFRNVSYVLPNENIIFLKAENNKYFRKQSIYIIPKVKCTNFSIKISDKRIQKKKNKLFAYYCTQ